jgi:hypothetical protein
MMLTTACPAASSIFTNPHPQGYGFNSSVLKSSSNLSYDILLLATAALGLGFGATVIAANTYAEAFFPDRADIAVLALNALLGTGTALAPLLVACSWGWAPGGSCRSSWGLRCWRLYCSAFFPLSISFGWEVFPRLTAVISGELTAFYQVGYGIAAFGVGPLRDEAGVSLSSIYAGASLLAAAMIVFAFFVNRPQIRTDAQVST